MTPPSHNERDAHIWIAGGSNLTNSHKQRGLHSPPAVGDQLPPAIGVSEPKSPTPGEPDHTSSQLPRENHTATAAGANFPDSHVRPGSQTPGAVGDQATRDDQVQPGIQQPRVVSGSNSPTAIPDAIPKGTPYDRAAG